MNEIKITKKEKDYIKKLFEHQFNVYGLKIKDITRKENKNTVNIVFKCEKL